MIKASDSCNKVNFRNEKELIILIQDKEIRRFKYSICSLRYGREELVHQNFLAENWADYQGGKNYDFICLHYWMKVESEY